MTIIKRKPRGRPFRSDQMDGLRDMRRNAGGKPFIKLHQKLSVIVASQLDDQAPADITQKLDLPLDSSYGTCIAKCAVELAARGDLGAARFVFECTEAAKVRIDVNERQEVAVHVLHEDARSVVDKLMALSPKDPDNTQAEQSRVLDMKPLPGKPS